MVSIACRALMEASGSVRFRLLQTDVTISIGRRPGSFTNRFVNDRALRAEGADRIGGRCIASQRKRLAATAAEVNRLSRAAPTRFPHPLVATERLKCG